MAAQQLPSQQTSSADVGGQITSEIIKTVGIVIGVAATPLLLTLLVDRFPSFTRWFWAVGAIAGLLTILTGTIYAFLQNRQRSRLAENTKQQKRLFVHWVPPFRIIVFARRQQLIDQLKQAYDERAITEYEYETRLAQLQPEQENAYLATDSWTLLPAIVIAIGVFILLPALVALLMQATRNENPALINQYFSTPVFLLWIIVEGVYLYSLRQLQQSQNQRGQVKSLNVRAAFFVGYGKSILQILAALTLWIYLGMSLGFPGLDWLLYIGAGLAFLGLILGIISALWSKYLVGMSITQVPLRAPLDNPGNLNLGSDPPLAATGSAFEPNVAPESGFFLIRQRQQNDSYYFQLNLNEGQGLLFSQDYATSAACRAALQAVRQASLWPQRYHRERVNAKKHYYVITDDASQILAMSAVYPSEAERDNWLAVTQQIAFRVPLLDETDEAETPVMTVAATRQPSELPTALPDTQPQANESIPLVDIPELPSVDESPPEPVQITLPSEKERSPQTPNDTPLAAIGTLEIVPPGQVSAPKFQVYMGQDDQFYFRLLAGNQENVLYSEGYKRKESCLKGIQSVKKNSTVPARFRQSQAENGLFFFSLIAGNYEVIGMSELYNTVRSRDRGIAVVGELAHWVPVEDLTLKPEPELVRTNQPATPASSPADVPATPDETLSAQNGPGKVRSRFEIFRNDENMYYFHLRAANHEIVLASEAYTTLRGCENGVRSVKVNAQQVEQFVRETAVNGQHYFKLIARNHRVIGISETYTTPQKRDHGIQVVQKIAPEADVIYRE